MIYLPGGPSHIDMYDLKPQAPVEFRGEFAAIPTKVPGLVGNLDAHSLARRDRLRSAERKPGCARTRIESMSISILRIL